MNGRVGYPSAALVEQAQVMVESHAGVIHAPENLLAPRKRIAGGARSGFEQLLDLLLQLGRKHLVGVQKQHPVVGSALERHLLLLAVAEELMLKDFAAVATGNVHGLVGAE